MDSLKNKNWNIGRWFVMTFICLVLFLLIGSDCLAQTVVSTPISVETDNPQPVVLRMMKTDGSIDSLRMALVASVKVGDQTAKFHRDPEWITITPPKLASGTQSVQLLDKSNREIGKGELL
jgi:hypothetical protein